MSSTVSITLGLLCFYSLINLFNIANRCPICPVHPKLDANWPSSYQATSVLAGGTELLPGKPP